MSGWRVMQLFEHVLHCFLFFSQQTSGTWRGQGSQMTEFCRSGRIDGVFLLFPPLPCPPLQISVSLLCLPSDIWLSGLPACEKPPYLHISDSDFPACTGCRNAQTAELSQKGLNSSEEVYAARMQSCSNRKERETIPLLLREFARGRGPFCINVTYIPLAIMGRGRRAISAVEFTDAAEFPPSHVTL